MTTFQIVYILFNISLKVNFCLAELYLLMPNFSQAAEYIKLLA